MRIMFTSKSKSFEITQVRNCEELEKIEINAPISIIATLGATEKVVRFDIVNMAMLFEPGSG